MAKAAHTGSVIIKKYANRRLYNTATSTYVTLEDLSALVHEGVEFLVVDAKSGEDLTRSVLTQIIFEQEARNGDTLLPTAVLRQLIQFYGDNLQMLVPSYLEMSLGAFARQQESLRESMTKTFGSEDMFQAFETQTRKNMDMFTQAMQAFTPFPMVVPGQATKPATPSTAKPDADLDTLKEQLASLQKQVETLARK